MPSGLPGICWSAADAAEAVGIDMAAAVMSDTTAAAIFMDRVVVNIVGVSFVTEQINDMYF